MATTPISFKPTFRFVQPAADALPALYGRTSQDQTEASEFGAHTELRTWPLPDIIRRGLSSQVPPTPDKTETDADKSPKLTATKIGRGGQASIFKISGGKGDNREVRTLKVYRQPARHTEGRMLKSFDHPNIIAAVDVFRSEDDLHCIAFKYEPGTHDLNTLLRRHFISPKVAIEICIALVGALDYIYNYTDGVKHRRLEVIHGDIKPANVLLTPKGQVQLIDFGVSTTALMRQRRPKSFIEGTPRYLDPNMLFYGDEQSHHSDIHAVLITLFEMIVGSPAKELMAGKYMHLDPNNYNKAIDELLLRFRSVVHQIWPDHIESFAEPMVEGVLSYLYLSPPNKDRLRLSAFQLSERLMTLLPHAPGFTLQELTELKLKDNENSHLDDQKTIVASTLFKKSEGNPDGQINPSLQW